MAGKFFEKPGAELGDRVPPGQHLAKGFPVLTYGDTPQIAPQDWKLQVWGLAKRQFLSWNELLALPQQEFTKDFHCVTRWSKLDVTWTGIKVTDVLACFEIDPQAVCVMQHCYGDYTANVSLADFAREENFFAIQLDGEPLPAEHGGPVRTVIPHLYAWKSAKWISGLEFLSQETLGFWEGHGYHRRGDPWAEERFDHL
ncbi:MAG: sulfite oxidase-like oxidoreductase [Spirulinaceae cyanobacterium SM2_1_0]|nr:sulfite oxidase-like oxidoreductase [Spirulinaceae cyanobacterium SM2_1_0]